MKLRPLEIKDAPLMLEWMHDVDVVEHMQANFQEKTLEDCEQFIENSQLNNNDLHLAVVDEDDTYMGTVSIKNIDREAKQGEFAITVRKEAMGKGFSQYAMKEIIRIAFEKMNLERVYWYVSLKNQRAVRFYEKNGYQKFQPDMLGGGGGVRFTQNRIFGIRRRKQREARKKLFRADTDNRILFPTSFQVVC